MADCAPIVLFNEHFTYKVDCANGFRHVMLVAELMSVNFAKRRTAPRTGFLVLKINSAVLSHWLTMENNHF